MKNYSFLCALGMIILLGSATYAKPRLIEFGFNAYSQFGEDGVIKKIFEIIGTQSKVAIEFGAWDGFHLSNTANLWAKNKEWKAILIEGDISRFHELEYKTVNYNCVAINAWVGIDKKSSLETILRKNNIDDKIDLLSIDIDGNDYHIFESLRSLRPRLIICEYNPTIPVDYDVYAPYEKDNNFGCSVAALNRIAEKKGYKLVALTVVNAFYVLKEDFEKFKNYETDLKLIDINDGYITLVTTYDGEYALLKNKRNIYFYGIEKPLDIDLKGDCVRCDTQSLSLIPFSAAYKKTSHLPDSV